MYYMLDKRGTKAGGGRLAKLENLATSTQFTTGRHSNV